MRVHLSLFYFLGRSSLSRAAFLCVDESMSTCVDELVDLCSIAVRVFRARAARRREKRKFQLPVAFALGIFHNCKHMRSL